MISNPQFCNNKKQQQQQQTIINNNININASNLRKNSTQTATTEKNNLKRKNYIFEQQKNSAANNKPNNNNINQNCISKDFIDFQELQNYESDYQNKNVIKKKIHTSSDIFSSSSEEAETTHDELTNINMLQKKNIIFQEKQSETDSQTDCYLYNNKNNNNNNNKFRLDKQSSLEDSESIEEQQNEDNHQQQQEKLEEIQENEIQSMNSLVSEVLEQQNLKMIKKVKITDRYQNFKVKCSLNHVFEINYQQIQGKKRKYGFHHMEEILENNNNNINNNNNNKDKINQLCVKCKSGLQQAQNYAQKNGGILLNRILNDNLVFQCSKDHQFQLKLINYQKRWCNECKKILKQELKRMLKEEQENQNNDYIKQQEKLYYQARQNEESQKEQEQEQLKNNHHQIIKAAQQVEEKVLDIAEKKAEKYFENLQKQNDISEDEMNSAIEVYKILLFPEDVLECYLKVLNEQKLKKVYKNYVLKIHPDKNCHPSSQKAFQKFYKIYKIALKQFQKQEEEKL